MLQQLSRSPVNNKAASTAVEPTAGEMNLGHHVVLKESGADQTREDMITSKETATSKEAATKRLQALVRGALVRATTTLPPPTTALSGNQGQVGLKRSIKAADEARQQRAQWLETHAQNKRRAQSSDAEVIH